MESHKSNDYVRGRPSVKFEIDFADPLLNLERIKTNCKSDKTKDNVRLFAKTLLECFDEKESQATQTDMSSDDFSFMISNQWMHLETDTKLKLLMMFFSDLGFDEQSDFFAFLGHCLNSDIYEESKNYKKKYSDLNFDDLKAVNKKIFYDRCDSRLKSFIDNLTENTSYKNYNQNFKSNIYENILKARNGKYISEAGLKEHMVSYLASGKARHSSQIFSKQGGKGARGQNPC